MQLTNSITISPTKAWGDDDGEGNGDVDIFEEDLALQNMIKNDWQDKDDKDGESDDDDTDDQGDDQNDDAADDDKKDDNNDDEDSSDNSKGKEALTKEELDNAWEEKAKEYDKKGIKDEDVLNDLKSNFHAQHLVGKQRQRIGDIKKDLEISEAKRKELEKDFKPLTDEEYDKLAEDKGLSAANKAKSDSDSRQELLTSEQQKELLLKNKIAISEKVPDFADMVDDMAKLIAEDDGSEDFVEGFKQNPYQLNPALAINLSQRAKLAKENGSLSKENEILKKQIEDLPKSVVDRMKNIGKNANVRKKGSAGGSEKSKSKSVYSQVDIGLSTLDELNE